MRLPPILSTAAVAAALVLAAAAQGPAATARPASTILYLAALEAGPVAAGSGQILGMVTDAKGRPQAGAMVEVRADGLRHAPVDVRTAGDGLFRVLGLTPGTYYVQAGIAPNGSDALLAERQRVEVHASERALLLFNLPALLRAVQFGPPAGISSDQAFDWALRQATVWRPILHWDDARESDENAAAPVAGYVALTAGAGASAFEAADLATAFRVDSAMWGGGAVSLAGEVGTNGVGGGPDTRVQATFQHHAPADPERLQVAVRQIAIPGAPALPSLRTFSLDYSNALQLGSQFRLQYGSMLNAVSLTDTVASVDPYLRAIFQISPQAQIEYRTAAAVPPLRFNRDFAEMGDPTPQVTLNDGRARLEHARHQEVRYSESLSASDTVTAAFFEDRFTGTAVNGAYSLNGGAAPAGAAGNGDVLPDLLNNMFIANGGDYGGWGGRFTAEHRMGDNWRAELAFSDGAVLAPVAGANAVGHGGVAASLRGARADAVTVKLSGTTPGTHTRLVCSYRAVSKVTATGLDLYDDTAAQSDSYANVFVRQPLPNWIGSGAKIAALVEIHNLLAQGYIPIMGSDGRTWYLVQSARSLRGGFTISF
ncbi:MAG TPA: carboxypeptidase regulatory-like domain-containing protein [Terriglobales bacterium]|nr:carboxypeptidase regulatory-like domain-containing protein [Terriglobales bacterium]